MEKFIAKLFFSNSEIISLYGNMYDEGIVHLKKNFSKEKIEKKIL